MDDSHHSPKIGMQPYESVAGAGVGEKHSAFNIEHSTAAPVIVSTFGRPINCETMANHINVREFLS